jgi:pyridoxamine 5'-phosphate oxidase
MTPTEADPIARFARELARAEKSEAFDATRCALATVSRDGQPSVRFVLLKSAGPAGFSFYTNLQSAKARDLSANPKAALAFHWHTTGVQVRVRGTVVQLPDDEADRYFASRPRGSQLGAWASPQSQPILDRRTLDEAVRKIDERFKNVEVPRPPHWGGYRLLPDAIEFWQNHDDRLHDRELYERDGSLWRRTRLAP